jgi:hypothetical protein
VKVKSIVDGRYKVLADKYEGVVRMFTLLPSDFRTVNAVKRHFPSLDVLSVNLAGEKFVRLGGWDNGFDARESLASAKMASDVCSRLYLVADYSESPSYDTRVVD